MSVTAIVSTVRPRSLWQTVEELLRFTPQFLAARGDPFGDFVWPLPNQPVQEEVQHHSENYEGYEERYDTERLTNQTPNGQFPDN